MILLALTLGGIGLAAGGDAAALAAAAVAGLGLLGLGGSLNHGGWTSNVIGGLLSSFRTAQGDARTAAASSLCLHLTQQVPIAPICFRNGTVLTQYGRVEGLAPVYGNIFSQLESWTIQE